MNIAYQPTWDSLRQHPIPSWLQDAKFGIYTHWGVYSVPAYGANVPWYPFHMYREGTEEYAHHLKTYGHPGEFGYKDFIPRFTGERFDPQEWADLFRQAGARFAGPVGEHHDGFCMWDTKLSQWNAARMGPRRDVVGELSKAIRAQGMKYMVALHHAENWYFFPHWRKDFDTSDPRWAGLYGEAHDLDGVTDNAYAAGQARPSRRFMETWRDKIIELIDTYGPDMLWFDFGLGHIVDAYKQQFLAHYYNRSAMCDREVVVTYKYHNLPPNVGVVDLELGREGELTYHQWITDTTVDDGEAWGYLEGARYKSATSLVHYLIDNVSKNGHLLLNVGPKPDGTIPPEAREILRAMGAWLGINGEAIYGTTPWVIAAEGPTKGGEAGAFGERKQRPAFTAQDVRFTSKGNALYAISLGWPGENATIQSFKWLSPGEVKSVRMLGCDGELPWQLTGEGLQVRLPHERPCEHAYTLKIERGRASSSKSTDQAGLGIRLG